MHPVKTKVLLNLFTCSCCVVECLCEPAAMGNVLLTLMTLRKGRVREQELMDLFRYTVAI